MPEFVRGRVALEEQIVQLGDQHGGRILLVSRDKPADIVLPRPLRPGRTLAGDWIGTPARGIRARAPWMTDAAILFALQHDVDEAIGVHLEPIGSNGHQETLMAANPDQLRDRMGFVAIVGDSTFEIDNWVGYRPWNFVDRHSSQLPVLGGSVVGFGHIQLPVHRVEHPHAAFYENPAPTAVL